MRTKEFKNELKKDKRLKAETITSYLKIAADLENTYGLNLDDVVADDALMESVLYGNIIPDNEYPGDKIKVLKRYYRFANKRSYSAPRYDSEARKTADAVIRLLDRYDELRMNYAGAMYADDKDMVSVYLMDEDDEPVWMGDYPTQRLAFICAMHYGEFFGRNISDFVFVDTRGDVITTETIMDFMDMLGGEDAIDALAQFLDDSDIK